MGVGSQHQAMAALHPGKQTWYPLHRRLGPYDILGDNKYLQLLTVCDMSVTDKQNTIHLVHCHLFACSKLHLKYGFKSYSLSLTSPLF